MSGAWTGQGGAGAPHPEVSRILRLDHSGERGAIGIYRMQMAAARLRCPELLGFLAETLEHEKSHAQRFLELMRSRQVQPCGGGGLWVLGGVVLGLLTGLIGRQAVLVCTEAVERTVHRHMLEQVEATATLDPEVSAALTDILREEVAHLSFAQASRAPTGRLDRWLDRLISATTEGLIGLSACAPVGA